MDFDALDKKILKSKFYWFVHRHERVIKIVEGVFILALLISINIYFFNDFKVKSQIREKCGYENDKWQCVCEQKYVDGYKALMEGSDNFSLGNLTALVDK